MTGWHLGRLAAFDLETTGIAPEHDRIVTASILVIRPQYAPHPEDDPTRWLTLDRYGWIAQPTIDIPAEAAAVHGITTERARAEGRPARRVIQEIAIVLGDLVSIGTPLVIMNAPYDLTLLDRELQRHDLQPLAARAGRDPLVIDPRVLDKQADRYRKDRRTLTHLCQHYGVELTGAHEAAADALAAAKVAYAIAERHPEIAELPLAELHKRQTEWAAEQAASLEAYLREANPTAVVSRDWPMIPRHADGGDR